MKRDVIRFDQNVCNSPHRALKLEWLETNGLGGFASSTITGLNTRRYHGLLTAATKPPVGRVLMLSKLEETFIVDGKRYELSANQYSGAVHPRGYDYLREFRLDPFPVFLYQVEGMEIEKRVFMVHGENTVVVEYELRALDRDPLPECELELRPLVAFRDYHGTTHRNDALNAKVEAVVNAASVTPYADHPPLFFSHDAVELRETADWYLNFDYQVERERGLAFQEDLFNPFLLRYPLNRRTVATVIASTGPHDARAAAAMRQRETARRAAIADAAPSHKPAEPELLRAAVEAVA